MSENAYLDEVQRSLPRVLALFDADATSATHGVGDRFHWAWGLSDFPNGTFQGAAHGLARVYQAGLWPYETRPERFVARLNAIFAATARITRRDGSLEEAFPYEGSYCVTALVAFDSLCAIDLMSPSLDDATRRRWTGSIEPLIEYLVRADETHAIISNHLATAAAALARWHAATGDTASERRARGLTDRILQHQSAEGWFSEYGGADPGYQSLCTYYLADLHRLRPDWGLLGPLTESLRFLWHFAHPDGSFGGIYGSRCTRFFYPAGIEALAPEIPEAAALARFMRAGIADSRVVTLAAMDEPNLMPMFNAYAWAAALGYRAEPQMTVPAMGRDPYRARFDHAGLLVDRGPGHYTVVAPGKGGVVAHFVTGKAPVIDAGVVVRRSDGAFGSTQSPDATDGVEIEGDRVTVDSTIVAMPKRTPGPWQFLVLRVLSVTVMRIPILREWIKRCLVAFLITSARRWPVRVRRTIELGLDLRVTDSVDAPAGYTRIEEPGAFVSIHMASQGYWQSQDER